MARFHYTVVVTFLQGSLSVVKFQQSRLWRYDCVICRQIPAEQTVMSPAGILQPHQIGTLAAGSGWHGYAIAVEQPACTVASYTQSAELREVMRLLREARLLIGHCLVILLFRAGEMDLL